MAARNRDQLQLRDLSANRIPSRRVNDGTLIVSVRTMDLPVPRVGDMPPSLASGQDSCARACPPGVGSCCPVPDGRAVPMRSRDRSFRRVPTGVPVMSRRRSGAGLWQDGQWRLPQDFQTACTWPQPVTAPAPRARRDLGADRLWAGSAEPAARPAGAVGPPSAASRGLYCTAYETFVGTILHHGSTSVQRVDKPRL